MLESAFTCEVLFAHLMNIVEKLMMYYLFTLPPKMQACAYIVHYELLQLYKLLYYIMKCYN